MSHVSETPFDNIENSHEYVSLLSDAIEVTLAEVDAEIALAAADGAERRREALQLVAFKLGKLSGSEKYFGQAKLEILVIQTESLEQGFAK